MQDRVDVVDFEDVARASSLSHPSHPHHPRTHPSSVPPNKESRGEIGVVVYKYRPPKLTAVGDAAAAADTSALLAVAGQLQGLLSTVAYAVVTGRVFVLDWPELASSSTSSATTSSTGQAFEPLHATLRCDFDVLHQAFGLSRDGSAHAAAAAATTAEPSAAWLCGTDPLLVGETTKPQHLVFSTPADFVGWAACVPGD